MTKAELKHGQQWRSPRGVVVTISAIYPDSTQNIRVARPNGTHYWVSANRFNNKPGGYQFIND